MPRLCRRQNRASGGDGGGWTTDLKGMELSRISLLIRESSAVRGFMDALVHVKAAELDPLLCFSH